MGEQVAQGAGRIDGRALRGQRDTNRMLADALEAIMRTIPLSQVSVSGICARCDVERRVFYYHFKDKYDLVAWMFEQDYRSATEAGDPYSEDLYAEAHRRLWERRDFYRRAFEEDAQNSIQEYLLEFSIDANERILKRYLGVPVLSREHAFEARHFAAGNIGCLIAWLSGRFEASPARLAACMFACLPPTLRKAYASPASSY